MRGSRQYRRDRFAAAIAALLFSAAVEAAGALASGHLEDLRTQGEHVLAYASFRYFEGNDWTAVRGLSGKWTERYSPRDGRNLALASARAEVGAAYGSWRLGYVYRKDVTIVADRGVLDLLYLQRNNLPMPAGRTFNLTLAAQAYEVEGPRVAKSFEFDWGKGTKVRIGLGVSSLEGNAVRSTRVGGEVTATGPARFALNVPWLDSYTKKSYLFLAPGSPSGHGYSLDGALELEWQGGSRAWLSVQDLYGRIFWREVPTTQANATTNTTTRDAQGSIVYLPAVSGQNSRLNFTQRIDPRIFAGYAQSFGGATLAGEAFFLRGNLIPSVSIDYRFGENWTLGAARDLRFGSVTLSAAWRKLSLALSSDQRDLGQARALGLALRYSHAF